MNAIAAFAVEVSLTFVISILVFYYLRPRLTRILTDLCGTEDRAAFWTVFSGILLVGFPLLVSLMYRPQASALEDIFFEITHKTSGNLISLLLSLMTIGFMVSVFALVAPRTKESS